MDTAQFTQAYLMYLVLPIWLIAGFADWLCHRAARIEFSSGPPPLPMTYVAVLLTAIAFLNVLPFIEELWRGLRAGWRRGVLAK